MTARHRLTLPSYDPGAAHIKVDGHTVGHVLGRFDDWQAYLWPEADQQPGPIEPALTLPTLADLRTALRRRLDEQGPWWKDPQ